MSPISSKLWEFAADTYKRTQNEHIEFLAHDFQEWYDACLAASQLYQDGYISDVPDFIELFSESPSAFTVSGNIPVIYFSITDLGLRFI